MNLLNSKTIIVAVRYYVSHLYHNISLFANVKFRDSFMIVRLLNHLVAKKFMEFMNQ